MRVILFDIDGTLLICGQQVRPLFLGALHRVFNGYTRPPKGLSFAGKTDPMITLELVRGTGLSEAEILRRLPEMREIYLERLESGLEQEQMQLLPGVVSLLDRLSARQDVLLGLLTGNWRGGAEIKLSRFGLASYFRFGAFGDDGVHRRDLGPVALERAAAVAGQPIRPRDVLVVGDTALDVDCARHLGAASLAVASGFVSAEELQAAGADWVFADLEEAGRDLAPFIARSQDADTRII